MAKIKDDFTNPEKHAALDKSIVESVIDSFLKLGNIGVSLASGLLAAALVIYSGYVIADQFSTQYKAYSSAWDLLKYKPEFIEDQNVPLSGISLSELNADYRAWLTVYDTSIDYPVVQGGDNLYYAWHDIYKNSSLTGSIYLASENSPDFSDSYNLIYGHHMDNGAMFGRLDDFRDEAFYNGHRQGVIVSQSGIYDVTIFAVANTDAYESRIYNVGNRMNDVLGFLASGGEGGVGAGTHLIQYDPSVLDDAVKIVALSTCADATTSGRLVVFGVMKLRETPTTSATVVKVWNDDNNRDGMRPDSLTVRLQNNVTDTRYVTEAMTSVVTLNSANDWTATVSGLPMYLNGEEIVYSWAEDTVPGYTLTTDVSGTSTTLTNTHLPATTSVNVTKTWDDDGNRDGLRPGSITVNLLANGIATQSAAVTGTGDTWTYSFDNLNMYQDGELITYAISETPVDNYTSSIAGYSITNTHTPATITVSGTKTWVDNENQYGVRPASIIVNLLANGTVTQSQTVTGTGGTWAYTFDNLPRYQNGDEIVYSVSEEAVENYTSAVSGYNITNTYAPISLTVVKVWDDNNDAVGMRPDSLRVTLSNGRSVILNESNGWTATVDNLPAHRDGQPIAYTWTEAEVLGYTQTGISTVDNVTTITNTYRTRPTPPTDGPEIPGTVPDPDTLPGDPLYHIDEYDTPLGINVKINHVGDTFD